MYFLLSTKSSSISFQKKQNKCEKIMSSQTFDQIKLRQWIKLVFFLLLQAQSFGLNPDGQQLLSFKYSIWNDPFNVLQTWNEHDETPCSWKGVNCSGSIDEYFRVTGLSLPNCGLTGSIPATIATIEHLRNLNLSNNSINGFIPPSLLNSSKLQVLDFSKNHFSGSIPSGFDLIRVLDLSSNLFNGSLPPEFGGKNLEYFNVSFNILSGEIPPGFGTMIPENAKLDLSFNNFTGPIPETNLFVNQNIESYSGNSQLCGKPLKNLCPIPSDSSPAIAAKPEDESLSNPPQGKKTRLRTAKIAAIVVGDLAGIGILAIVFLYVYRIKKKKNVDNKAKEFDWASSESSPEEYNWVGKWNCSKKKQRHVAEQEEESSSEITKPEIENPETKKNGSLVTLDGEKELELETLLKASAYILGASSSSIMYKAVLEDGTMLAVRRIGENGVERFKDFENQVRVISKLVHPNLIRIRGFYWGAEDKLIIYDFVPNGSLANARYRKNGTSPIHLPWEMRLKIAKGVARGLLYIHEKKHVHGNLKPSNILLGLDMEPKIGDFGLERLVVGDISFKPGGSARYFGSKRSTASKDSLQDFSTGPTPSPSPSVIGLSPYHAPESLRNLKPNSRWDVFAFGVVLLELLTGKVIVSEETGLGLAIGAATSADEEKGKVLRLADVAIRADMEGREDALLAVLKLGYNCISHVPQRRPSMKEVLQVLEKFPSSSSFYYGNL